MTRRRRSRTGRPGVGLPAGQAAAKWAAVSPRPLYGSWAVTRCPCCDEDNIVWLPDRFMATGPDGERMWPQNVVMVPDGRVAVRWAPHPPTNSAANVEVLAAVPVPADMGDPTP